MVERHKIIWESGCGKNPSTILISMEIMKFAWHVRLKDLQYSHWEEHANILTWIQNTIPQFVEATLGSLATQCLYGTTFNFSLYGTIFNFSYDNENHQWIAASSIAPTFKAVSSTGSVLRSQEWTVHNDSKLCGGSYTAMLSFSSCSIEQFTCSDGNCVDIGKRLSCFMR